MHQLLKEMAESVSSTMDSSKAKVLLPFKCLKQERPFLSGVSWPGWTILLLRCIMKDGSGSLGKYIIAILNNNVKVLL